MLKAGKKAEKGQMAGGWSGETKTLKRIGVFWSKKTLCTFLDQPKEKQRDLGWIYTGRSVNAAR